MKMFSVRRRNKSKHKFVATAKLWKVREYLSPKIQNENFRYCVNKAICSLDHRNVVSFFSENLLPKVNQK